MHPESGDTLAFPAEAVWVRAEEPGAGVSLLDFGPGEFARLGAFLRPTKTTETENVHLRVRRYSTAEQLRAAREGDMTERVARHGGFCPTEALNRAVLISRSENVASLSYALTGTDTSSVRSDTAPGCIP